MSDQQPLAQVRASQGRRYFAYGAMLTLGVLLILVVFRQPPAIGWAVLLLAIAGGVLFLAEKLRHATRVALILLPDGLHDSDGQKIADISEITKVERGVFAFKPSNGFLIHMTSKAPAAWQPGLWWRVGRRIGVGGVVSAGETKFMADQMAMLLAGQSADQS